MGERASHVNFMFSRGIIFRLPSRVHADVKFIHDKIPQQSIMERRATTLSMSAEKDKKNGKFCMRSDSENYSDSASHLAKTI